MPSVVKNNLNQVVTAPLAVAEIVVNPRPFVGLNLTNLGGQEVLITGLLWSIFFGAPADAANAAPDLLIQRGLTLTPGVDPTANVEECVMFQAFNDPVQFSDAYHFTRPVVLQTGYSWGIAFRLFPRAPFAGAVQMFLTVMGDQVRPGDRRDFPYLLR